MPAPLPVWQLMAVALRSPIAVAISLFLHVFVNIAMVVGLAPVVGVPLPLISYGGTSLFSLLIGLGLCLGIAGQVDTVRRPTALVRGEKPALP